MIGKYLPTYSYADSLGCLWPGQDGVPKLQYQLAALLKARHVFVFRSARNALYALLRALGDTGTVVVPAYNCIAVPEAVGWAGWQPVFADTLPGDVNMTRETLEACLPKDVHAVLLTHQFGIPPPIEPIFDLCQQRRLFVIEDAAAALGAKYRGRSVGSFGDATIISFHLTKVVNAGRCGALLINNDSLAQQVASQYQQHRSRVQGLVDFAIATAWSTAMQPLPYAVLRRLRGMIRTDPLYEVVVPNRRPPPDSFACSSGFAAHLASIQIDRLRANVAARQALASLYASELAGIPGIRLCTIPEGAEPAWIQFPIFVEQKEACYRFLLRSGVDLNWTFRYSCGESYCIQTAPNAAKAARTLLGLPTYPGLSPTAAQRICVLLRRFFQ